MGKFITGSDIFSEEFKNLPDETIEDAYDPEPSDNFDEFDDGPEEDYINENGRKVLLVSIITGRVLKSKKNNSCCELVEVNADFNPTNSFYNSRAREWDWLLPGIDLKEFEKEDYDKNYYPESIEYYMALANPVEVDRQAEWDEDNDSSDELDVNEQDSDDDSSDDINLEDD